jgi:hypothetical protein
LNNALLHIEIQEFININLNTDITTLLLKGTSFKNVETRDIIEQIESKKRCEHKLPSWFAAQNMYYPNKLNIEQTSSEITAQYKSELIKGNTIIDITGGFGVDCFYFSKQFKLVMHCEIDESLSNIVSHNYKQLQVTGVNTQNIDGLQFLKATKVNFDWIYIDPSRRHSSKGKVFFLNDCSPNIPESIDALFERSNNIMIKTSPLLDLTVGIKELKCVKSIHVVAVDNEVKELLWILEKAYSGNIEVSTVNLKKERFQLFSFELHEESNVSIQYHEPLNYLYEPNAAILKAGAFKSVASQLHLFKLHINSHLYTHNQLIDFPGRRFKIEKIIPYSTKNLKKEAIVKANITLRNFPESVSKIRGKHKIKDGGNLYLFFTTNFKNEKIIIVCTKANYN